MKCMIIDDEMASRAILKKLCEAEPDFNIVGDFCNCLDALRYLNDHKVDIIFLDLHMEVFNGFDLLKTIGTDQKVVLTTSDQDFALKSYEYTNIVDYLVKPIARERFEKAVDKVRKQFVLDQYETTAEQQPAEQPNGIQKIKSSLYINIDRRLINIHYDDIFFVEADGDYIYLNTASKNHRVHTTLKRIKERLPEDQFVQIHRSYIINFDKIIDIQDSTVLIDKKIIPISRSKRATLLERLNL